MTKVNNSIAHGNHITLKLMMKNVAFLPLLSCEYVYARPSVSATIISTKLGKKLVVLPDKNTGYWKIPPAVICCHGQPQHHVKLS